MKLIKSIKRKLRIWEPCIEPRWIEKRIKFPQCYGRTLYFKGHSWIYKVVCRMPKYHGDSNALHPAYFRKLRS